VLAQYGPVVYRATARAAVVAEEVVSEAQHAAERARNSRRSRHAAAYHAGMNIEFSGKRRV